MPPADLPDTFTYTEARKAGLSKHRCTDSEILASSSPSGEGSTAPRRSFGRPRPLGGCATIPDGDPLPHLGIPATTSPISSQRDMTSHSPAGHGTHMGILRSTGTVSTPGTFRVGGERSHST